MIAILGITEKNDFFASMTIYGTAILSLSLLIGLSAGRLLGALLGVDADIGGVGIAMILLIFSTDYMKRTGRLKISTESGISFWGTIYVPVVVAMSASQNVRGALSGGVMASLAGALGVAVCFGLVALFVRLGRGKEKEGS
jgi:malonate transporter MadL subunit